jgi:branched-chain amino acid transport system permease protein
MAARFQLLQGTSQYRTYKWVAWGLWILVLVLFAFAYADTASLEIFENKYNLGLPRTSKALSFAIAVLGLQVIVGYTGQLALGQGFFFGTGAYVSAWLVADHNWSWFVSLLVVVPVCFLIGMLFGLPALRIRGLYLALVTLGMAATFPSIVQLDSLDEYTGGAAGKTVDSELVAPGWFASLCDGIASVLQALPIVGDYFGDGDLGSKETNRIYTFTLIVLLLFFLIWLVSNLLKSRPGRAIRAIRDNETSAAVSGVDLTMSKTLSFGLASAIGGVGGLVYVAELGIASPGDFTQLLSILFIVGLVTGGVGTLSGAVIGGLVIAFVPEWASSTEEFPVIPERWLQGPTGSLILGILLIILMFFMPGGIVAGVRKIKGRVLTVTPAAPLELGGPTSVGDSDATNVTDDTPVGAEQPGDSAGDDTADEVPTT